MSIHESHYNDTLSKDDVNKLVSETNRLKDYAYYGDPKTGEGGVTRKEYDFLVGAIYSAKRSLNSDGAYSKKMLYYYIADNLFEYLIEKKKYDEAFSDLSRMILAASGVTISFGSGNHCDVTGDDFTTKTDSDVKEALAKADALPDGGEDDDEPKAKRAYHRHDGSRRPGRPKKGSVDQPDASKEDQSKFEKRFACIQYAILKKAKSKQEGVEMAKKYVAKYIKKYNVKVVVRNDMFISGLN
jgi:hypothetical protein